MPGGLMQLMAYGSQNEYLNGNPQLTFFKVVYKRYTNFSMEYIRQNLNGPNQLDERDNIRLTCKLSRNADLIFNTFFVFKLPDIYSGYDPESLLGYKFQWIEEIGNFIIDKTSISIGSTKIDEQYGDWMSIWSQFNVSKNLKYSYDMLIGNTIDMYNPENIPGNDGIYPTSTINPDLNQKIDYTSLSSDIDFTTFDRPPSILGRKIYVPLTFWFCNNSGLAIPLISLQYHDIFFNIELRPISSLYTIIDTDPTSQKFRTRVKPNLLSNKQNISNFLFNGDPENFPSGIPKIKENNNINFWDIDPHLLINYIFLDNNERRKFAQTSHEYLISQIYREEHLGVIGNKTLKLNLRHPVKTIIWTTKRNDMESRNIYNNYTNWEIKNINPFTFSWINYIVNSYATTTISDDLIKNKIPNKYTFKYYKQNILKTANLKFEGQYRVRENDYLFYNYLQPYTTSYSNPSVGVYSYSFELDNYKFQPSGACNMSRIKNISLWVETQEVRANSSLNETLQYEYYYDIIVYSINYNILRIMAGMAGLTFSN